MIEPWIFTGIVMLACFLLYRYGYYRGVVDCKELREELRRIQDD